MGAVALVATGIWVLGVVTDPLPIKGDSCIFGGEERDDWEIAATPVKSIAPHRPNLSIALHTS
jgi:hypothetical protein